MAAYEPGSFRDPDSAVFASGGHITRWPSAQVAADWERFAATDFFGRLCESGRVVATAVHEGDAPPSPRGEPWALVLEHERVPVVTYPYEWPFVTLRTAALNQLDVQLAALEKGTSLERLLDERFLPDRQQPLPGGTRTMYLAESKP